ncbi:MarR family transcriptional regulator [Sodalis sp. RH16]|uniref:MarR family transcriptional regulator n=1 Tax=Sodalis sp. RH16 TaxID=3394331 RepID=UPI0039B62F7C
MTNTKRMTTKQRISRYVKKFDGPTVSDICRSLSLSKSAVGDAVKQLREEGVIIAKATCEPGMHVSQRYYPVTTVESLDPERTVITRMALFDRYILQTRGKGGIS